MKNECKSLKKQAQAKEIRAIYPIRWVAHDIHSSLYGIWHSNLPWFCTHSRLSIYNLWKKIKYEKHN